MGSHLHKAQEDFRGKVIQPLSSRARKIGSREAKSSTVSFIKVEDGSGTDSSNATGMTLQARALVRQLYGVRHQVLNSRKHRPSPKPPSRSQQLRRLLWHLPSPQ